MVCIPKIFLNYNSFGIISLNYLSLSSIIIYGLIHPHFQNKRIILEFSNNYLISVLSILMVSFTPFVLDLQSQFFMGYIFIGVLVLIFINNMTYLSFKLYSSYREGSKLKKNIQYRN